MWKNCHGCGRPFEVTHELRTHCSDICRARAYRKRHRKTLNYCAHCFSPYALTPQRGPRSRYCSNACKQRAYRQRIARRLKTHQRSQAAPSLGQAPALGPRNVPPD